MIFNEYTRTASAFMSRKRNNTLQEQKKQLLAIHITMTTNLYQHDLQVVSVGYLKPSTLSKTGIQVSGCSVMTDSTS